MSNEQNVVAVDRIGDYAVAVTALEREGRWSYSCRIFRGRNRRENETPLFVWDSRQSFAAQDEARRTALNNARILLAVL